MPLSNPVRAVPHIPSSGEFTIPAEHLTETVTALRAQVLAGSRDLMPILADAMQDAGCADESRLDSLRDRTCQTTREGGRVVLVGRDGADHDLRGNSIYTTNVYEARRRKDGQLR